jgi:hypothetical protein
VAAFYIPWKDMNVWEQKKLEVGKHGRITQIHCTRKGIILYKRTPDCFNRKPEKVAVFPKKAAFLIFF